MLAADQRAVIAVSGGCDSTALMVLFADWLAAVGGSPERHVVVTIDHRLRPESAGEALAVARRAARLGFRHQTLVWDGHKPATGLQAAARQARYRLLGAYALGQGMGVVMTGHTADDQAETLLMRLARGSGIDGLSAMAPATTLVCAAAAALPPAQPRVARGTEVGRDGFELPPSTGPVTLVRPLLGMPRARLRAILQARAIDWHEDPSNTSPAFERTRLRAAADSLAALGLTWESLALSARRLQRARAALERAVDEFCAPCRGTFTIAGCGFARIDASALRHAPGEIAIRVLLRAISAVGGCAQRVPLAKLEAVAGGICARERGAWTLARTKITATPGSVVVVREAGRAPPRPIVLAAGQQALWDGRFLVRAGASGTERAAVEVRALGAEGVRVAAAAGGSCPTAPAGVLQLVPAFYRNGALIAVPNLAYWAAPELRGLLTAVFAPICSCNLHLRDGPER